MGLHLEEQTWRMGECEAEWWEKEIQCASNSGGESLLYDGESARWSEQDNEFVNIVLTLGISMSK